MNGVNESKSKGKDLCFMQVFQGVMLSWRFPFTGLLGNYFGQHL